MYYDDLENADRFAETFKNDLGYVPSIKSWRGWNGKYWENASPLGYIREFFEKLISSVDYEDKKKIIQCRSNFRIQGMLNLAKQNMVITENTFDQNDWLLNFQNGTYNLSRAQFREHKKEDYITKILDINYSRDARAPRWKKFMSEIMQGSQELVMFLQRALGYALTGSTKEQAMFVLHGDTNNGKSKFLWVLRELFGDYGASIDPGTLMVHKNETIRSDLARLKGTRFVSTREASHDKKRSMLDESIIKQITGDDILTVRFLNKEYFELRPTWKVFFATNYQPYIAGADPAIQRRMFIIPFYAKFGKGHLPDDKEIEHKLLEEKEGIMPWIINGCLSWISNGLRPPSEVITKTSEYHEEMDPIGAFVESRCFFHSSIKIAIATIYEEYKKFCRTNGDMPLGKIDFGRDLKQKYFHSIKKMKSQHTRYWSGIALKHPLSLNPANCDKNGEEVGTSD